MSKVLENFLRYISYDTQSQEDREEVPSTRKQFRLAEQLARELGEEGGACVLSPAAASYGIFKNFEERGEYFRQYIFGQEGRQAAR